MKANSVETHTTSYTKRIDFSHDGKRYLATLTWTEWDGYELNFTDERGGYLPNPKWAEDYDTGERDLHFDLDRISDELRVSA